jgi:hypothetical protein
MSARAAASALFLIALTVPAFHGPAQAGPWLPARGEYSADLRGTLFTADTYRNDDGDRFPLGGTWEERSLGATVEMGWKKTYSLVLGAPFVSATAKQGSLSRTDSGLEDLLLGVRYGVKQGPSAVAVELDWKTPLGYSRTGSLLSHQVREVGGAPEDSLVTGGLQTLTLSLLCGGPIKDRGFWQLGAGFGRRFLSFSGADGKHVTDVLVHRTLRPDTLVRGVDQAAELWTHRLALSADAGWWFGRGLLIGGRYAGTVGLSHGDLYPDRTEHLVGPFILYRVDERLDVSAGSWSTFVGRSVLHRDEFYAAITFKQTHLNRLQGFLGGTKAP